MECTFHKRGELFCVEVYALIQMLRAQVNDVPGYDKDQYMPDELKDENGKAYAYRDAHGNYYELNFGLTFWIKSLIYKYLLLKNENTRLLMNEVWCFCCYVFHRYTRVS